MPLALGFLLFVIRRGAMTKAEVLYRLQCLDGEGDAKQRRLAAVEAALGESDALKQARRALESAQALVQRWRLRQRDLELETQGIVDRIARSEQRLYSGAVKNPKELTDLQAEVAALRRRRQKLEEDLLTAMIELETAETTHTEAREHLDKTQASWSAQQADLLAEREALQARLAELGQKRAQLLPSIAAEDLADYQSLRRRKRGLAVVQVQDGICGGCGVGVPSSLEWQLRQEGAGYCANCGRIVVRL
jgi:predicted  nucleic acid-binding Zn-ribbon protein